MKLLWQVEDSDIKKAKSFYESQKNNAFVLSRIDRNINKVIPQYSKDLFWKTMISCLITTQQRSGPNSPVKRFICANPFPLNYLKCKAAGGLQDTVEDTITAFGGLRRGNKIGGEVESNFKWLEKNGWDVVQKIVEEINNNQTKETERRSARIIMQNLKGFGPKQSRNLLQALGIKIRNSN